MTKNNKLKKSDLSITVVLLIGILIVVNFFSYNIFYRFDLTENKIYSISDASKNTLGDLEDIVNIKAYFSSNLPSQLLSLTQEVEDLLDEYVAYSGGKVKLEYIDPKIDDEKTQQELYYKGIPQLTFEVVEKDKQQLVAGYMGLTISFGDNTESIPALKQNISDLEYQLTTKIKKVVAEEVAVIGFLSSHGAPAVAENMQTAYASLGELYTIRMIDLAGEEASIDADLKTLIIAGAKEQFSEDQLKEINAFVARGGALIVLADGVAIGDGLVASAQTTGLETLLGDYGLKLNNDLVADQRSGRASFSQGFFSFSTAYPFWPLINSDGFSEDYSAVAGLENVILPWSSSISIDESKLAGVNVSKLIQSTEKSWTQRDTFQIVPNQIPNASLTAEKYNLAVAINGEIKNPYAEGDEKMNANIIVVGDSDFATEGFIGNNPDNLNLFLNIVDSVSLDDDLIEIRSKVATSRPIDETDLDDAKRASLRYMNVFGITVLVVIFGVSRYFGRRRSRFVDDL